MTNDQIYSAVGGCEWPEINTIQSQKISLIKKKWNQYEKCPDDSDESYENVWYCWTLHCKDHCDFKKFWNTESKMVLIQINMVTIQINMVIIQINMVIIQIGDFFFRKCPDDSYESYENVWHCWTLHSKDNCDF